MERHYAKNVIKLLLIISCSLVLIGCSAKKITLYPIKDQEIFPVKKGTKIGDITVGQDGYYISKFYLNEISEARLENE